MRWLIHILAASFLVIFTTTVGVVLFGQVPFPNLIFIGVTFAALRRDTVAIIVWPVVGGLLLDLVLPGQGIYLFVLSAWALLIGLGVRQLESRTPVALFLPVATIGSFVLPLVEMWHSGSSWGSELLWTSAINMLGFFVVGGAFFVLSRRRVSQDTSIRFLE